MTALSAATASHAELLAAIANAYGASPAVSAATSSPAALIGAWHAAVIGGGNPYLVMQPAEMLAAIRNAVVGGTAKSHLAASEAELLADMASTVSGATVSAATTSLARMLAIVTGSTGLTASQRARAASLLAVIDAANAIADATGNDVVTWSRSGSFGNATLNNTAFGSLSSSLLPRGANATPLSAVYQDKPAQGAPWTQVIGREDTTGLVGQALVGQGYRFRVDASAVEIACAGVGPMRMKVNGAWSTVYAGAEDTGFPQVKASWPTKAVRDIEFYDFGDIVIGFNVASGDTITAAPALNQPNVALFGDSYVESNYSVSFPPLDFSSFGQAFKEATGFADMLLLGQGGQGAVHGGDRAGKTFLDRVNAGDLNQRGTDFLDLIVFYNSINDYNQTAATIKANWKSIIAKVRADHPAAFIWGFSGFEWVSSFAVDSAHNAAFVDAFTEMAATDRLVGVKDGDGLIITASGDETSYKRSDDPHFNAAGCAYAAGVVKPWLRAFLAAKAA